MKHYISGQEATRIMGITPQMLGRLARNGVIDRKGERGHRSYRTSDVRAYARNAGTTPIDQDQIEAVDAAVATTPERTSSARATSSRATVKLSRVESKLRSIQRYAEMPELTADEALTLIRSVL